MATARIDRPRDIPLGMTDTASAYKLSDRLAGMDHVDDELLPHVEDAASLLKALVVAADGQGRHYADPALIMGRVCYRDYGRITELDIYRWRETLLECGDITVSPDALNSYGGIHLILYIQHKHRFQRWANRPPIPKAVRTAVYERDGFACVTCKSPEALSIDHIHPWSLGGPDHPDNYQTLCRPCNSRKGNRLEVVA